MKIGVLPAGFAFVLLTVTGVSDAGVPKPTPPLDATSAYAACRDDLTARLSSRSSLPGPSASHEAVSVTMRSAGRYVVRTTFEGRSAVTAECTVARTEAGDWHVEQVVLF